MVQKGEHGHGAQGDAVAHRPPAKQRGWLARGAVMSGCAAAVQAREVVVAEATEHLQLSTKLAIAGTSGMVRREALHGLCTSAA